MDLYSKCEKCNDVIYNEKKEEARGYPKAAITLLKEDGRVWNIDLCYKCRKEFVRWLKGETVNE